MIAARPHGEPAPGVGPDEPAAAVIGLALSSGLGRLRQHEAGARHGEVEGVHRMRTATRRLRSELRLFADLLDGDWAERLSRELQWLGRLLGAVRDADVMRQRLRESAAGLVEDLGPLFTALAQRHASASAELRAAIESKRYRDLLEQLGDAALHPALGDEAWEPSRAALPPLVQVAWRRLRSVGRRLDLSADDEQYHEVRKRAKRARYCAEGVAAGLDSAAGNHACRFALRSREVQDVLGEHQDATVACQEIRTIAADHLTDGPFNLAAGRLLERQENAAARSRARFYKIWQRLDRKKNRRWMKV